MRFPDLVENEFSRIANVASGFKNCPFFECIEPGSLRLIAAAVGALVERSKSGLVFLKSERAPFHKLLTCDPSVCSEELLPDCLHNLRDRPLNLPYAR